ncbi:hypothetical protein ES708_01004 [subsurface metagenome]
MAKKDEKEKPKKKATTPKGKKTTTALRGKAQKKKVPPAVAPEPPAPGMDPGGPDPSSPPADLTQQVKDRVRQEAEEHPDPKKAPPEITPKFIADCLFKNELGDGELFAAIHRDRFVYNNNAGEWYEWAGHHWRRDIMGTALSAIEDVTTPYLERATLLRKEADRVVSGETSGDEKKLRTISKSFYDRANRLRGDKGRTACLKFARTCRDPLAVVGDEFDLDPMLLGVANGVIDLRTGELIDGRQTDYISMASSVEWKGIDAKCDLWDKSLLEIFDDKPEMVDYQRRLLGYAISGSTKERVFAAMWGQGWNGKGVIANVITNILDPLAGPIPSEMLLDQGKSRSSAGPSPDIMMLRGLRIAFASESDEGRRFSAARVKWFTGSDVLTGRYPHDKMPIRFKPSHTLFMLTNSKPYAPGGDFAFWERLHLIPFKLSFVKRTPAANNERQADLDLEKKLLGEYPGILAWLVRGCLEWQAEGLNPPDIVLDATAEYRSDEDIIGDFIASSLIIEPGARVKGADLYGQFQTWYIDMIGKKENVPSNSWFGRQMATRYNKTKISGCVWYHGIGLPGIAPAEGVTT